MRPGSRVKGLTIASWNIRAGKDASVDELAARLATLNADVIALQEVEVGTRAASGIDQAWEIAERLGMQRAFAATLMRDGGMYGIALLSRVPIRSVKRVELPGAMGLEPRVLLEAAIEDGDRVVRVVATHADVLPWAGERHAAAIAEYLDGGLGEGVVVLGDFNLTPNTKGVRGLLARGLRDAVAAFDERPTGPPWPLRARIDYVFMDRPLAGRVEHAAVVEMDGSDHYPVVVHLKERGPVAYATGPDWATDSQAP